MLYKSDQQQQLHTKVGVKPTVGGQVLLLVKAQVPLAHHVRGVACLLQFVRQGGAVQGQTIGLSEGDDAVLQSCVNLINWKEVMELEFFRFRFRFFIHQVLQQGKCLESGKHTNISKQQH